MSIIVRCPHCETLVTLGAEMRGKSTRCPNLECRLGFTAVPIEATAPHQPIPELPPEPAQVIPPPPKRKPAKPPKPTAPEVEVVEATTETPPQVKEVVWTEGTDVPLPKKRKPTSKPKVEEYEEVEDLPLRRRKKSNRRPMILATLGILIVAMVGFGAMYVLRNQSLNEERLAKQAEVTYAKGDYAAAAKQYEKLAADYAASKDVEKYKFFADLAVMQTVVRSVANREDFASAIARLNTFIEAHKDSSFAKPTTGFGRDVLEAGKKLAEDIAEHAKDRVKAFQANRKQMDELTRAESAIAAGRALLPTLDPFRGPDDPALDTLKESYDQAEKGVQRERDRTAALNRVQQQLESPTDSIIQTAEAELAAAGLLQDPEAQSLLATARGKLRDLVRYEEDAAPPQLAPPTAAASLLFVMPIGKTALREPAPGDPPSTVFLCVSRGILYALDEDSGALLWATRVGQDVTEPPAIARVTYATGLTDLAVVTSNVGNTPAVSGVVLKTGATQWYQPLPAAAAGPVIVVGTRAFVPIRDAMGTVYEFDLTTGTRIGRIRIGQPVAEKGAVLRPGTSLLYVAAESRRLYVIDVVGRDDIGNRVDPRCVQVIVTGHLAGTLRVPPLFIGPEGTEPAQRWMLLTQADGPATTNLRAIPVGPITAPAAGSSVPESLAAPAITLPVPGWVWFTPTSDGERIAVVSDTGQFRLIGVNQLGNADKALFHFPAPTLPFPPEEKPLRGLVIPVEESTYWLLAAGQLQKARLALVAKKGHEIVLSGMQRNVGEPVHAAQTNARKDTACLVVRSPNSSGCRAIAFNLRDGEIRWQRQLGLVPAKVSTSEQLAAPIRQDDRFLLVDEDGSIVAVPVASGVGAGQTLIAPAAWVIASTPINTTGPTVATASADGKIVYTISPIAGRDGAKFFVRRVVGGKLSLENEVNSPAALAGQPAIIGDSLLIPTADGFVNRFVPGAGVTRPAALIAGPSWRGDRPPANAVCTITPLSDSAFATSDGGKKLSRWEWPTGANALWNQAGAWELREAVAGQGIVVPPAEAGGASRLIVADSSGGVWMFAADKTGPPLRRWPSAGKPSSAFAAQPADAKRMTVTYVVDGHTLSAINPDSDERMWPMPTKDDTSVTIVGSPQPAGDNRWVITDITGHVVAIDGPSGKPNSSQLAGLPGTVPAAASGVAANTTLTLLSDGSAVVTELRATETRP